MSLSGKPRAQRKAKLKQLRLATELNLVGALPRIEAALQFIESLVKDSKDYHMKVSKYRLSVVIQPHLPEAVVKQGR